MIGKTLDALHTVARLLASALLCLPTAFPAESAGQAAAKPGGIQQRVVPPVAGIDLEQALNYTDAEGFDLAWFYESFTYYKAQHARNRELAKNKAFWDSGHAIARREHPLDLFQCVGYQNYFVH
jgi:hypothetical protein